MGFAGLGRFDSGFKIMELALVYSIPSALSRGLGLVFGAGFAGFGGMF